MALTESGSTMRVLIYCLVNACFLLALSGHARAEAEGAPSVAPSAEVFGKLPFIVGPQVSPNGTRILAQLGIGKQQLLGIVSTTDPAKPPVLIGLSENELIDFGWVNDDWLFARLGDQSTIDGYSIYTTRLVGVSADGKTIKPIALREAGQHAQPIWIARDGTPRMLVSMQKSIYEGTDFWPSVVEADVSTGKIKPVVDPVMSISSWIADGKGQVRVGVGTDARSGKSRVMYRPNSGSRFETIARRDAGSDETMMVPFAFSSDGKTAVTYSNHEGFTWLYALDLTTFALGDKVVGVAGFDLDGATQNVNRDGLEGVSLTSTRPRTVWMSDHMATMQASLEKALGKDSNPRIISFSNDQKHMIVESGAADQAGLFHYFSAATGQLRPLALRNEALRMDRLGKVSTIKYKASDGVEIAAVLTVPRDRAAARLPLIVMPHGGPYGVRDSEAFDWWSQFLATRGYAVVQPNYRGSGGYGRGFEKLGEGQWGTRMQDDLNDVITHLAGTGLADPGRVCMVGGSYGGYAAMRAAQRDPARYRCAISYAGVSDLIGMKEYDRGFLYGKLLRAYWKEVAPDLKSVSPLNFPEQFGTPILIMHGAKDKRVPIAQSRKLAERLKSAGKSVVYIEQPKGDHHFTREEDRVQFLQEMEAFLKLHNPA